MRIIPAIDILDGKCTRLFQGNYDKQSIYLESAQEVIEKYLQVDAKIVHIVDLSAAKDPSQKQTKLISKLVKNNKMDFQVGGGLRTFEQVKELYDLGVSRVIIGSMAINDIQQTEKIFESFPQTVLAADIHIEGELKSIATHGWKQNSKLPLETFLNNYPQSKTILCTDISKDGTLTEPNFSLYQYLVPSYPKKTFIASGGVSSLNDLKTLQKSGVQEVVIGKALFEGRFTLTEALQC